MHSLLSAICTCGGQDDGCWFDEWRRVYHFMTYELWHTILYMAIYGCSSSRAVCLVSSNGTWYYRVVLYNVYTGTYGIPSYPYPYFVAWEAKILHPTLEHTLCASWRRERKDAEEAEGRSPEGKMRMTVNHLKRLNEEIVSNTALPRFHQIR